MADSGDKKSVEDIKKSAGTATQKDDDAAAATRKDYENTSTCLYLYSEPVTR